MHSYKSCFSWITFTAFVCLAHNLFGQAAGLSNVTYQAGTYAGADAGAKINACITSVIQAGGGICDASDLGGTQNFAEQVLVGSAQSEASRIGVTLLLPNAATWQWHMTDSASCGLRQYGGTSIVGPQPGGGGNNMILTATSGSSMDSIYCTDSAGSIYVRAEGFSVFNHEAGNTFTNGVAHIQNVVDESSFTRIFAGNYYGDAWHVTSACCGTRFDNIQGISNGQIDNGAQGGVPLTIGSGAVRSVAFYNSTFNAPGSGLPDILIQGESMVMGVNFFNTYMEGNGAIDASTSMVLIESYVGPIHFFGGIANTEAALPNTKAVFENHGFELDVHAFDTTNAKLGINDFTKKMVIPTWNFSGNLGTIESYTTAP